MTICAYARVSTTGQSLEVQLEQLRAAGAEEIFQEQKSGTSTQNRDQLEDALRFVRRGDVFLVTRLDRLARSMSDLRKIVDTLMSKGVGLRVLQQAINTDSSEGRLLLNLLGSFAEFETEIRKERQMEGIAKAKSQGRYKGRPTSIDRAQIAALRAEGFGASAIAKKLGIGRASVYRLAGQLSPCLRSPDAKVPFIGQ